MHASHVDQAWSHMVSRRQPLEVIVHRAAVTVTHCLTPGILVCSLIDFNFSRPSGSDLGRYRNVLFNAKGGNQPMAAQ